MTAEFEPLPEPPDPDLVDAVDDLFTPEDHVAIYAAHLTFPFDFPFNAEPDGGQQ